MCAALCAAPWCHSSEDRLIYLLSQAQQIQELLATIRSVSDSGLLQCVAAAAAGGSCPVPHNDTLVTATASLLQSCGTMSFARTGITPQTHCTTRSVGHCGALPQSTSFVHLQTLAAGHAALPPSQDAPGLYAISCWRWAPPRMPSAHQQGRSPGQNDL